MSVLRSGLSGARRAGILALAVGLAAGLAGCGDPGPGAERGTSVVEVAVGAARQAVAARRAPAAAAPAIDQNALAAVLKSTKESIIVVQMNDGKTTALMGEYGRNGPYLTYAAKDRRTISLRHGLVAATRGLGHDLMSSDPGATLDLIRNTRAGSAARTYRYLNGEGFEARMTMTCQTSISAGQAMVYGGANRSTRKVDERCSVGPLKVENSYWVTSDGQIALSRQWVGQQVGYVGIQVLRP